MPVPPKIQPLSRAPTVAPRPVKTETDAMILLLRAVEQNTTEAAMQATKAADIAARSALAASRSVRLYGARHADAKSAFWKNNDPFPVAAEVVVTKAGPVGATLTFDKLVIPADMKGNTTHRVGLDPNDEVTILFSDPSVEALLVVYTPTRPLAR